MSLTKIDVAAAGSYYLEAGEVHGDIASPVHGDLAIYTYAPAGGFLGQEYSFATSTGWFERTQISEGSDGNASIPTVLGSRPVTPGTAAEMAADAAAIILAGTEAANQGKRWENTTDGLVYDFRPVGGTWAYYLETNADASGNVPVAIAGTVSSGTSLYVTQEHVPDGGSTDIAIGTGSALILGDMSPFGIPYTNITLTKTGANAVATVTWAVSTNGLLVIDLTMNAADSITITADNLKGDTFANPIMYMDASDGVVKNAALTGSTAETISIWAGR